MYWLFHCINAAAESCCQLILGPYKTVQTIIKFISKNHDFLVNYA